MRDIVRFLGAFVLAGAALQGSVESAANATTGARAPAAPTLAELIARNTQARGGTRALDRMHSLLMESEFLEGGKKFDLRYAADRSGLVKVEAYVDGKYAGSEGVDKNGVWIMTKHGPEPSVATGDANALTNGAEDKLIGWNRFAARGHKLSLLPPETIDGVTYQVVQVHYSSGHVSNFYVDPNTWLAVRRRDERAFHPDGDQTKQRIETVYSNFRKVSGVVQAHMESDYDLATGKVLADHPVLRREVNPKLPPDYFDRNRKPQATW